MTKTSTDRSAKERGIKRAKLEKSCLATTVREGAKKPLANLTSNKYLERGSKMHRHAAAFEKLLDSTKVDSSTESYLGDSSESINPTTYSLWHFADDREKARMLKETPAVKKFRQLGDGTHGLEHDKFWPFSDELRCVRDSTLNSNVATVNKC